MQPYDPGKFAKEYATPEGQKLWEILNQPANIARMQTASDLGQPALKPLEEALLEGVGRAITDDWMKKMAGNMVRQIMEANGYEHDVEGIKLASFPFYKASRYRRRVSDDAVSLHVFRDSGDARQLILTDVRSDEHLPTPPSGKRWTYYNVLSSPLKAQIGLGLDLKAAANAVEEHGYHMHRQERVLRPGPGGSA